MAELPEVLARPGPAAAVQAVRGRGGDAAGGEGEARHGGREVERIPTRAVVEREFVPGERAGLHHVLSDARRQPRDHLLDGLSLGAGGEAQRHAVLQDGLGQSHHVVD